MASFMDHEFDHGDFSIIWDINAYINMVNVW